MPSLSLGPAFNQSHAVAVQSLDLEVKNSQAVAARSALVFQFTGMWKFSLMTVLHCKGRTSTGRNRYKPKERRLVNGIAVCRRWSVVCPAIRCSQKWMQMFVFDLTAQYKAKLDRRASLNKRTGSCNAISMQDAACSASNAPFCLPFDD